MAAIKMQPLVIDMGGEGERKFASEADWSKARNAQAIKIINAGGTVEGVYRKSTPVLDAAPFTSTFSDDTILFVREVTYDSDGAVMGSVIAAIYSEDGAYYINIGVS